MHQSENIIGPSVAKYRYQRGWTQDELVGKLQLLGCYMTRDILANIETLRRPATDRQIEFLAHVFDIAAGDLFPGKRHYGRRIVGLDMDIPTRKPCANRRPRSKTQPTAPLAEPAGK